MTLVMDIDHVHIQEITTTLQDTHRPIDHLQDQAILVTLDHVHIQIQDLNLMQYNDNTKQTQLTLKYICINHPSEMAKAVTPISWLYSLNIHTPSNLIQRDNPTRFEISFFLYSGASISVLNYPTYVTFAQLLNNKQNNTLNHSKTLTVAIQTEVPILHYVTVTLTTTVDDDSRQFTVPFTVADIKYNILGTPFFVENIQNLNIQNFTLQLKHQ